MPEKLKNEPINVRAIGHEIEPGVFMLMAYIPEVDYRDAEKDLAIWSIGVHKQTNQVYAAIDTRFYENPLYDCIWLR